MGKVRKSKCQGCGLSFDTPDMELIGGKKYCSNCAPGKKEESQIHKDLCQYIYDTIYQGEGCNMQFITKTLKSALDLTLENGMHYTYKGMLTALKYAIDYEGVEINSIKDDWGIYNLIEIYYPKAYKFYEEISKKNKEPGYIERVLTKEPNYVIMKRSDILERQKRDEEERLKRYLVKPMTKDDMEEILKNYEENSTRETGIIN